MAAYVRVSARFYGAGSSPLVNWGQSYYESFLEVIRLVNLWVFIPIRYIRDMRKDVRGSENIEDARDGKIEMIHVKSVSRFGKKYQTVPKYSRN